AGKDLVGEGVDDEPVAAGECLDEPIDATAFWDAAEGECGELQARDPAFGALFECLHVGGGEVQAHHPVEELLRLRRGEAEGGGAQLGGLLAPAETWWGVGGAR